MGGERAVKYQNSYLVAVVLFLVATSVTMMQYKIPTIMTSVMEQLGIGADAAAWLMSIFTFVGIFFALPVGMLLRRFGPRRIIAVAVALDVVASSVGGFAPEMGAMAVPLLLFTRALEGLSLMSVIACGPVVIQLCVDPEKTGTASGIWMLGGMLGATIAGVSTPALYYSVGFRGLWLAYAAIVAIAGVVFLAVVKIPPQSKLPVGGEDCGRDFPAGSSERPPLGAPVEGAKKGEGYSVFFKRNTLVFFVPFAVFQIMLLAVLSFAPTALQQRGMDPALSGLVSTIPMLLAVVSSIAFGAISDKTHRCKPLFIAGVAAMTICTPLMLTMDGLVMWIALVVMGLVAMGTPAIVVAAYPQILGNPRMLTIGMGVLTLVQSLGQFLGSLVPSMLLGPSISQWALCAGALFAMGLAATACSIACRFR